MSDSGAIVTTDARGGVLLAVVRVAAIDTRHADRLVADVGAAIDAEGRRLRGLVLDLSHVGYVNSRGLAACIDLARRAEKLGATSAACGLSPDLTRMFEVMRVDRLMPLAADAEAARRLVLGRDPAAE